MTAIRKAALSLLGAALLALAWIAIATQLHRPDRQTEAPTVSVQRIAERAAEDAGSLRSRLARNPADYATLLALAVRLASDGKRDESIAAVRATLKLAPADRVVLIHAADLLFRAGNEPEGLAVLRQLADLYPTLSRGVWPIFSAALDSNRHRDFFERAARDDPRWWPEFFEFACKSASAPALQSAYLVRASGGFTTETESRCAIDRLQRERQWTAAYHLWLNSLPIADRQRVGFVYNGGFEAPLSNLGFDWIIQNQPGVAVGTEWTNGTNGRRALHVRFVNKRYTAPPVYEYLLLAPGRYRFEGRGRAEGLDSWLGLQWGLYCIDPSGNDTRQLAHTEPLAGSSDWTTFRSEFAINGNCPLQILRLELANPKPGADKPGDAAVRLKGSLWYDDLRATLVD